MILGLIGKMLPAVTGKAGKLGLIVTLISCLTGFYMWDRSNTYQAGYNEAALQYQIQMSAKVMEELTLAKQSWQVEADKAIAAAKADRLVETVVRTVYRDVYRTDFICKDIGENALELLNRVYDQEAPNVTTN